MTYVTADDMAARYGADEMDAFDDGAVTAALADASIEMDSYLGARYALPLDASTTASQLLKRLACAIARYLCYDDVAPEMVIARAKDARAMLAKLSSGTMVLPDSTGTLGAPLEATELAARAGPAPVMTAEALEGL